MFLKHPSTGQVVSVSTVRGKVLKARGFVRITEKEVLAPGADRPKANSSKEDWAHFAEGLGIDVAEMTRAEIIAAVEQAEQSVGDNSDA